MTKVLQPTEWDQHFISEAFLWARKSKDRRTQVGAVIICPTDHEPRSHGYNGPLRGLDDANDRFYEKPIGGGPSPYMEHAERNAITNAARLGTSVKDCSIYVTLMPCDACARSIINAGIRTVIVPMAFHPVSLFPQTSSQIMGYKLLRDCRVSLLFTPAVPLIDQVMIDGTVHSTHEGIGL